MGLLVGGGIAVRPPLEPEDNGLSENESAALWSRDTDNGNTGVNATDKTAIQQLAAHTDITYKRPPSTAGTWTRNDYRDFEPGGDNTSVHPGYADLTNSTLIKDAHSTIFVVQPSTRGHLQSGETPLYIAPDGRVLGVVDYRVSEPAGQNWTKIDDQVTEVRLKQDGEVIARTDGTQMPAFDYAGLESSTSTVTIEAEIEVTFQRPPSGTQTGLRESVTDTVVVSDSVPVNVYDLQVFASHSTYPNGDVGVAIYQNRPWQSYQLSSDGTANVRGVWRFYTARDTRWESLIQSTEHGTDVVESDAIPVYVHAFPSVLGPQARPVRTGPDISTVWGSERPSPAETIGENVHVGVVDQPYTPSHGVAVRHHTIENHNVTVRGIVRGVNSTIREPDTESKRQIRRSNLTMTVLATNGSQATVRIELRDEKTGEPIGLDSDSRRAAIVDNERNGYISVAGERVRTNHSGVAITTVTEYGSYTAQYHPESWLSQDPAYVGDRATVQYHPLLSFDGWLALLVEVGWQFTPFLVAIYLGLQLGSLFTFNDTGGR
ncbi:hypothetical protein [Halorussus salinisoli]|uniref:hypothetical protein n=1 Tax=Halorussus salinisoli TaxID=2558242 RepID=UPI002A91BAE9|nr:hypothetical protein [Halorussus salinisoli]